MVPSLNGTPKGAPHSATPTLAQKRIQNSPAHIPVYLSVDLRNMRTCVSKSSVRLFSRVIGTIMGPTAAHTVKQPVLQKGVLRACGRGTRFEAQKPSAHTS